MVNPVSLRPREQPADPRQRLRFSFSRWRVDLLALLGFLGLSVLLFAESWRAPATSVAGAGTEDIGIIVWFLRWVPFALGHAENPLITTYLNAPQGVNSMWNASMPVAGLAMWPFTSSLGPIFSYNLLVTLAVALSAWCAFLAARRYVESPLAATLAGLLYGFSPYMIAQSQGHLHVTLAFIPPLMLLVFDEIVVRQRRSAPWMGVLLGLLAASQLLLAEEVLATEALCAMLGVALLITLYPQRLRPHRPHALAALGVAAAVFLTLAAVPIGFQFFGPQHVTGAVQIRNAYVSDLLGFVVPTARQQFAPAAAVRLSQGFSGYSSEWDAYLGVPLIGLLVYVSVRFWTRPLVRVAATLMLMLAVLSLGTTLHIAGQWTAVPVGALALMAPLLRRVIPVRFGLYVFPATWVGLAAAPILSSALPARLMLYVFLFAGLLLAVGRRGRMAGGPHGVLYRKRGRFIEAIQSSGDRCGPAAAHPPAPVSGRARGSSALLRGQRREATPARHCGLSAPICPAGEQFGHVLASRRRYALPHAGGVCAAPRPLLQQPAHPDQQRDENDRAGRGASRPQRRPPGPSPPRP